MLSAPFQVCSVSPPAPEIVEGPIGPSDGDGYEKNPGGAGLSLKFQ